VCAATVLAAEMITVKVPVLDVWTRKGSMFGKVATLKDGDSLQIIEKQPDGWMRVTVGEKEGYVKDTALLPPKSGGFAEAFKGMNVGRADASDASASMAARGIEPGARFYVNARNYRTDGLDEMMSARDAVAGPRFEEFIKQGNVGPAPK